MAFASVARQVIFYWHTFLLEVQLILARECVSWHWSYQFSKLNLLDTVTSTTISRLGPLLAQLCLRETFFPVLTKKQC